MIRETPGETHGTRCDHCRFVREVFLHHASTLECRRHAPVRLDAEIRRLWPSVGGDDWCGDYEPVTFPKDAA